MKDLRVLHLNTYDGNGGAGRACLRLSDALRAEGIESEVLVLYQFHSRPHVNPAGKGLLGRIKAVFRIFAERYLAKLVTKAVKTPFSLQWFGQSLKNHPKVKQADVLHIHWINHGFLNPSTLAELDELEKPIVWTFHDSNAFTGGCHVRYSCENFHRQCGHCPLLRLSGPSDLSHFNWKKKQQAYSALNFHIIAPSHWMAASIKESSLLGLRQVSVIPNTLETQVFKPYVKEEAKRILKIQPHQFVILSGFMPSKNDKHKGTSYLTEALNELASRMEVNNDDMVVVVFGNKDEKNLPDFPFKTLFLGTIQQDDHLAKCYAAADVFVLPSLEDNLPNTVMESLSCATPVVAFETGGIPDMVRHLENGYLAKYKSASDLADGIEWLFLHEDRHAVQKEARRSVLESFAPSKIAAQHLVCYQELIKQLPQ